MAAAETQSTSPKKFEVCGYICSESAGNSAVFHTGLLLTAPPPPTGIAIFFVLADLKPPSHCILKFSTQITKVILLSALLIWRCLAPPLARYFFSLARGTPKTLREAPNEIDDWAAPRRSCFGAKQMRRGEGGTCFPYICPSYFVPNLGGFE